MSKALVVPDNIALLPLPPRSPELNPVENVWQYLRDNVSGVCRPYRWLVDAPSKAHGVRSSMRLLGWPAVIASRVPTR